MEKFDLLVADTVLAEAIAAQLRKSRLIVKNEIISLATLITITIWAAFSYVFMDLSGHENAIFYASSIR